MTVNETPTVPVDTASGDATEHAAAVDDAIEAWLRFATAADTATDTAPGTGESPVRQVAYGVLADRRMLLALAEALPDRPPGLVLATSRMIAGTDEVITGGYNPWRDWVEEHWAELLEEVRARTVQANVVNRAAALLPALGAIQRVWGGGPLAILEVGCSAGLLLQLDRFRYVYETPYGTVQVGPPDSPVTVTCTTTGDVPVPADPPVITWRAGLDPRPLYVTDRRDRAWLEAMTVWPGQDVRRAQHRAAVDLAAADPPYIVLGGAGQLHDVAATMPADVTRVVIDYGVGHCMTAGQRAAYAAAIQDLGLHHVSADTPACLPRPAPLDGTGHRPCRRPDNEDGVPGGAPVDPITFVLQLDGRAVGLCELNAHRLYWRPALPGRRTGATA
ncbi:MAG: DUF2332 family protein [Nocardiopsaceae bacterium]|nr:DUF2332 family protein [Nocardiopsaceae bacterium]